jgi:uncharacterized protein YutE (UPF0331/DUF86 family)
MVPGTANQRVIADRLEWVQRIVDEIRLLPLGSIDEFTGDRRNIGAAESCLRRALEALLDLGRHLLAKIFGEAATEYKKIAEELERKGGAGCGCGPPSAGPGWLPQPDGAFLP